MLALPGGHHGSDGTPHLGLWLQYPEGSKTGGRFGYSICPAVVPAPADLPSGALPTSTAAMSPLCFVSLVDSNDSLYGGDSKFLAENNKLCEMVMTQILEHLRALAKDEVGALLAQSHCSLTSSKGMSFRGGWMWVCSGKVHGSDVFTCDHAASLSSWWACCLLEASLPKDITAQCPFIHLCCHKWSESILFGTVSMLHLSFIHCFDGHWGYLLIWLL